MTFFGILLIVVAGAFTVYESIKLVKDLKEIKKNKGG